MCSVGSKEGTEDSVESHVQFKCAHTHTHTHNCQSQTWVGALWIEGLLREAGGEDFQRIW